jgi:hypothetical protein
MINTAARFGLLLLLTGSACGTADSTEARATGGRDQPSPASTGQACPPGALCPPPTGAPQTPAFQAPEGCPAATAHPESVWAEHAPAPADPTLRTLDEVSLALVGSWRLCSPRGVGTQALGPATELEVRADGRYQLRSSGGDAESGSSRLSINDWPRFQLDLVPDGQGARPFLIIVSAPPRTLWLTEIGALFHAYVRR